MKYRARVVFRAPVLIREDGSKEGGGYWGAPHRLGRLVAWAMHSWVSWEGSLPEVFHSNIRRVKV